MTIFPHILPSEGQTQVIPGRRIQQYGSSIAYPLPLAGRALLQSVYLDASHGHQVPLLVHYRGERGRGSRGAQGGVGGWIRSAPRLTGLYEFSRHITHASRARRCRRSSSFRPITIRSSHHTNPTVHPVGAHPAGERADGLRSVRPHARRWPPNDTRVPRSSPGVPNPSQLGRGGR
jgi:hypothetical protein